MEGSSVVEAALVRAALDGDVHGITKYADRVLRVIIQDLRADCARDVSVVWAAKQYVLDRPYIHCYAVIDGRVPLDTLRNRPQLVALFELLRQDYSHATLVKAVERALKVPEMQLSFYRTAKAADEFVRQLTNRDDHSRSFYYHTKVGKKRR